jgi:hypothetical protein
MAPGAGRLARGAQAVADGDARAALAVSSANAVNGTL